MNNSTKFLKLSLVIILIPIGLLTKLYSGYGSEFITNHLGGVIYVLFFILLASLVFPKTSPIKLALIVFCITCILEFTQLIQTLTLDLIRKNFFFSSLFGTTFNPFDFIWYFVGALFGLLLVLSVKKISE